MTSESGQPTSLVREVTRIVAKRIGIAICSNKCLWSETRINSLHDRLRDQLELINKLQAEVDEKSSDSSAFRHMTRMMNVNNLSFMDFERWCDGQDRKKVVISPFSATELKTLINLCHPDKHQGKQSAVSITQKLLGMRGKT